MICSEGSRKAAWRKDHVDHYWKLKEACTQGQERENVPGYCHSVFSGMGHVQEVTKVRVTWRPKL